MGALDKTSVLADFLSEADLAAIRGPVENARGLPGRAYGAGFYELEQRRLFPRCWCPVAFASEIAQPGDALSVELAGWPLLLVRGEDRRLRSFLNVCRHRAMRVSQQRRPTPQLGSRVKRKLMVWASCAHEYGGSGFH